MKRFKTRGPHPVDPSILFWEHVETHSTGCWKWHGSKTAYGYGQFKSHQKKISAHRYSYEIHYGPIPHKMHVCHTCDNPQCANPKHLFLGTSKDNVNDMMAKGRHGTNGLVGEAIGTSKLTETDVLSIRQDARSNSAIARAYGVSHVLVGKIKRRMVWKHLP